MNPRRVWIVVIVVIILELWFTVWVELSLRYPARRYRQEVPAPYIWYSTDQT